MQLLSGVSVTYLLSRYSLSYTWKLLPFSNLLLSLSVNHGHFLLVVSATIAPNTRGIPELTAEDAIRLILANLNLVVPVS